MTATRFINIATEDRLSEAVAERLVACYTGFAVDLKMGLQGNGHLRKNLKSYFEIADRTPLLLMTDLDDTPCVVKKLENWKKSVNRSPPPNFLFCIAVREVEAWLLADHKGFAGLLELEARHLPDNPDALPDPKKALLKLAEKAPKAMRRDLIGVKNALASQGLGYNTRLGAFVKTGWNPDRAAKRSASLKRACERLGLLYQAVA